MRQRFLVLVGFLLAIGGAEAAHAQAPDRKALDRYQQSLDSLVPALLEELATPGAAAALIRDGKVVVSKGYGWADREGSEEGRKEIQTNIDYYMSNAGLILEGLDKAGLTTFGGVNAPYVWLKTPNGLDSWQFFDELLEKTNVVGTPGSGFGAHGEGYFRLSAFGIREKVEEAIERISESFG